MNMLGLARRNQKPFHSFVTRLDVFFFARAEAQRAARVAPRGQEPLREKIVSLAHAFMRPGAQGGAKISSGEVVGLGSRRWDLPAVGTEVLEGSQELPPGSSEPPTSNCWNQPL